MKLVVFKMPLILGSVFACGAIFGMAYVFVTDTDNNLQKFMKEKYVILKEPKIIYFSGDQGQILNLPAGTVMYYEYSHKDFDSYASIQIKADYLSYEEIVQDANEPGLYIMGFNDD